MARRSIDIAFTRTKVAVFIDGCFWHGCPEHGTVPRANADWWLVKLQRNKDRDAETEQVLKSIAWRVCRIWEHESPDSAAERISAVLRMSS